MPVSSVSVSVSLQVLGWVSLITVAGVSFYFAKQSINERRRQQDIAGERPSARLDCERCDIRNFYFIVFILLTVPITLRQGRKGSPETKRKLHRHQEKSILLARTKTSWVAPGSPARRVIQPNTCILVLGSARVCHRPGSIKPTISSLLSPFFSSYLKSSIPSF
jgi:hypothetical protein